MTKRNAGRLALLLLLSAALSLLPCPAGAADAAGGRRTISWRYVSKEEGAELMLANTAYYAGFSRNDLDYKTQRKDGSMEEYLAFAREQTRDFTDEEKALIDGCIEEMEAALAGRGYVLPPVDTNIFIKTTMDEEGRVDGYTHGTQIYLGTAVMEYAFKGGAEGRDYFAWLLWHELFHCLTRCSPDFREEMYRIIHFTIEQEDYPLPPSVFEYHISNPDVERHNAWASFLINGREIRCFTDLVTTRHFENPGDDFFENSTTALVPIDGTDIWYTPEQAENFDEVFGTNTDYVVDPEECMADNFADAMFYGLDGQDYPNPEIIEAILNLLTPAAAAA